MARGLLKSKEIAVPEERQCNITNLYQFLASNGLRTVSGPILLLRVWFLSCSI